MPLTKAELRERMRRQLRQLPDQFCAEASARICAFIAELDVWRRARCVMCYIAMPTEVQTGRLIELAWSQRKRLLAPHVDWDRKIMTAIPLHSWQGLAVGRHGTMQSPAGEPVDHDEIDLLLAPGLAFGPDGYRLGRGGGFFDRFLRGLRAVTCGLAFDCQRVEQVPHDEHDVPVQMLVSESGIAQFPVTWRPPDAI